jgi:aminopeptidase N
MGYLKVLFRVVIVYIIPILLSKCSLAGLNISHATPKRPFKYPAFSLNDTLHGQLNRYRSCYDVTFYNLNVEFNLNKKTISGFVDFYIKAVKPFDTLQIDLYSNLNIDSIVYENKKLSYFRKYNAVFVIMTREIIPSENKKMTVFYHGKPVQAKRPPWEGGFVWSYDKNNNPWISVACEVNGASLWWPVKDHLTDEPDSMKLNFTIPSDLMCVSNGHLTDSTVKGRKTTYRWKVTYPINTYNATFYIGNFKHFSIPYKSLDSLFFLDFYVLPYNLEIAKIHFEQTVDILHFFESKFGPYPWPRDGYKLVESPFAGMEHQTAIAYGNDYSTMFGLFDYIILHETAHEWWGNSVTAPDYAEAWIHEGFATYSEALYMEYLQGHQRYNDFLNYYAMLIRNKKPVVGPHDVNYWDYKDTDVYMKGALTLHTLRNIINNDSIFFNIIKEFYERFKYKIACTQDFIDVVNEKTNSDYTWFFNQYLYNRTCPLLQWDYIKNKETNCNELYFRWLNIDDNFPLPIHVKTDSKTYVIRPSTNLQKVKLALEPSITMNFDGSYIALKRSNRFK